MSVVTFKIDRLNVFHRFTKKHAGTLEVTVMTQPSGAEEYLWSWRGGPLGPQSGTFRWHHEFPGLLLDSLVARTRVIHNKPWIGINRPPPRPWFKWQDNNDLLLVDENMKKSNPDYSPNFAWDLKLISAAQS